MRLRDEGGSAAVELAILTPVILALLGSLIFLADLGVARIRQRAVVRLVVWEATAHALSDEREQGHDARFEAARQGAEQVARERYRGGVSRGMLAGASLGSVRVEKVALDARERIRRPAMPAGFGSLLEPLGSLIQRVAGLQLPLLRRYGLSVDGVGLVVEAGVEVEGSGLLPGLPERLSLAPARLELQVDTWALDDGADVPLPGTGSALGRQVGRIALFGIGEKLTGPGAGDALSWVPISLSAPVVSMNYGPPAQDRSPVSCGGKDALARTGRWENGPRVGTGRDRVSPVRCFDTLPIDANGFGVGGGRSSDPVWRQLAARGPFEMGCDRPGAAFPDGCGNGGAAWTSASAR
ncbi:TadE/TadG family type IV pilus assembly protein [Vulgatibacter sp.]|uniref:TadE/TadG family type IV pilus assembly protein n=1 Tax=Vulgatibacter sp. TaxID=1971226 RepID=UPI0035635EE3